MQCGGTCKGPVDFNGVATWGPTTPTNPPETVDVSHPRGQVFSDWLVAVGASTTAGQITLNDTRNDVGAVNAPTTRWLYDATTTFGLSGAHFGVELCQQSGRRHASFLFERR